MNIDNIIENTTEKTTRTFAIIGCIAAPSALRRVKKSTE